LELGGLCLLSFPFKGTTIKFCEIPIGLSALADHFACGVWIVCPNCELPPLKLRGRERVRDAYKLAVMLRIRTFGADADVQHAVAVVETSRGAQVPASHALRGLRFVRAVVARGEAFQTNGKTFHLGHYKIDRIETDGTLTAGCHVIPYSEIERIAPELGRIASAEDVSGIA